MARTLLAIAALALIAASCGSGPLPAIPAPRDSLLDRFPSKSDEPLDLHVAIRRDKLDDIRRLLRDGTDPNVRWGDRGDHHPLQEALDTNSGIPRTHRLEIVRLLLAHGADPNLRWCPFESRGGGPGWVPCRSAEGVTPLIAAAAADMTEIVELLLAAGADPTLKDWSDASALDHASGEITFELIARKLFPRMSTRNQDALASLEMYDGAGRATARNATPLSRAISGSGMSWYPPFPLPPEEQGMISPYQRRGINRVRLLLNIGADPNKRVTADQVDWTPLALATARGLSWTAQVLLQAGADPNARWCFNIDWDPPSQLRPKDPACQQPNGTTPLMLAASRGNANVIDVLLEHGADPSLTDWNGKSASDFAKTDDIRALLSRKPS